MNFNSNSFKKIKSFEELNYTLNGTYVGDLGNNNHHDDDEFQELHSSNESNLVLLPNNMNQNIELLQNTTQDETKSIISSEDRGRNQVINITQKCDKSKRIEDTEVVPERLENFVNPKNEEIKAVNESVSMGKSGREGKNEETEGKIKNVLYDSTNGAQVDINESYYFQDSGIGDSYLIGTDLYVPDGAYMETWGNAFVKGKSACPEVLNIPGELTSKNGNTKPVEIIGTAAFMDCLVTKSIKVPWQVKIIKELGIGVMNNLESFEIEAGSQLETIESYGITTIGPLTQSPENRTGTLILPSTLSSVFEDGIFWCNIFHTIIYCGSHLLSNISDLESVSPDTVVKVTSDYSPSAAIFSRYPNRTSEAIKEAESECQKIIIKPTIAENCCSLVKSTFDSIPSLISTFLISRLDIPPYCLPKRLKIQFLL